MIGFQVDDEAMVLNKELIAKLLELDDVDAVYTDQKWSESLAQATHCFRNPSIVTDDIRFVLDFFL